MKGNMHDGHRDRMRSRIEESGIDTLQSHEMLEYILYAYVPRKDTNAIAHELIDEFGSFAGVLNADAERLVKIKGVSKSAAQFISSLPDIFRRYTVEITKEKVKLKGRGKVRDYFKKLLYGSAIERVYIAGLDAQDNLIKTEQVASGSGDAVELSVRKVVDFAIKSNASAIIIAHNHPSGSVKASQQDYMLTKEIAVTLASIGILLLDHFIFGGDEYYSFEEDGLMKKIKEEREHSIKDGIDIYV